MKYQSPACFWTTRRKIESEKRNRLVGSRFGTASLPSHLALPQGARANLKQGRSMSGGRYL